MSAPVHILLVEDDDIDAMAVTRAFKKHAIGNPLTVARDGIEGLEALRGGDGGNKVARPNLVLLDLNMPRMNGLEFLEVLRNDPKLRDTIVFVLTTSDDDRDICAAYGNNIAGYVTKQSVGDDFEQLLKLIRNYWDLVIFPRDCPA